MIADDVGDRKDHRGRSHLCVSLSIGERLIVFAVLCPPHLVEQWTGSYTASSTLTLLRLPRPLLRGSNGAWRNRRRCLKRIHSRSSAWTTSRPRKGEIAFARACPLFVIVDEAHSCVGAHLGRQQRFELPEELRKTQIDICFS